MKGYNLQNVWVGFFFSQQRKIENASDSLSVKPSESQGMKCIINTEFCVYPSCILQKKKINKELYNFMSRSALYLIGGFLVNP